MLASKVMLNYLSLGHGVRIGGRVSSKLSVAIVGWHEGLAGVVDSWLSEVGYKVNCFISINSKHLTVNPTAHSRFGNRKFAYPKENEFKGRPLREDSSWYTNPSSYRVDAFLVALDDNQERINHINDAMSRGIPLVSAIHPSVKMLSESSIGHNCILHAGAIIGYKVILGNGVILNTGSQIDHHVVVEDGVTIGPGCVVAGNVLIKECATLHSSTMVINKIVIGSNSVTGAGSVVIRDVKDGSTVVGVPARPIV